MIDKIERIARIKRVDNDVGRRFDTGRNKGGGDDGSFASELWRVLGKKTEKKSSEIPEAYSLELTDRGANSLFYFGKWDLPSLLN